MGCIRSCAIGISYARIQEIELVDCRQLCSSRRFYFHPPFACASSIDAWIDSDFSRKVRRFIDKGREERISSNDSSSAIRSVRLHSSHRTTPVSLRICSDDPTSAFEEILDSSCDSRIRRGGGRDRLWDR